MQVVSVGVDNIFATLFGCHGNVFSQTGKKVQIYHLHARKSLSHGEKITKIGPIYPEIFDTWRSQMSSVNSGVRPTGPNFTKFSHDIEASFMLLMRYPIPFRKARAISAGGNQFCHKIGCHGNVPWGIGETGPDWQHSHKYLPFGEKLVKIGLVDPEITLLNLKKKKFT